MCGCSNFVEDEGLNFTGNRPSIVEVGEDSSFEDFTGNRPSMVEVGEDPSFDFVGDLDGKTEFDDFLGKKAKARRQERRALRKGGTTTPEAEAGAEAGAGAGAGNTQRNTYESSNWFSNNWIYVVIGVAVIGGGYYFYKKRK